jgi:threonylcarbamoyladenosine tRNA methylthiotransferase MtaB
MRILRLVPDLARLRISSIDSIEADEALMGAIATEPRLMPHLHLSLAGRRRPDPEADEAPPSARRRHPLLRRGARLRPDIVFGADIIAGFPTETEEMFARSLDLVDDCGLTFLHVFPFSARARARLPRGCRR